MAAVVPETPKRILRVPCPACGARRGLQCACRGPRFDLRVWAHEARIAASKGWCREGRRARGLA